MRYKIKTIALGFLVATSVSANALEIRGQAFGINDEIRNNPKFGTVRNGGKLVVYNNPSTSKETSEWRCEVRGGKVYAILDNSRWGYHPSGGTSKLNTIVKAVAPGEYSKYKLECRITGR